MLQTQFHVDFNEIYGLRIYNMSCCFILLQSFNCGLGHASRTGNPVYFWRGSQVNLSVSEAPEHHITFILSECLSFVKILSLSSRVAVCCISQCTDMKTARSGRTSRSLTAVRWVQEQDRATISTCPGTRYTTLIYSACQCLRDSFQDIDQFIFAYRSPKDVCLIKKVKVEVENDHARLNYH